MNQERIVIIEDNEQNAYLARYLLEKAGFEVVIFPDPYDGMEEIKRRPPRLVLLDIQLPQLDGYSVAEELNRDESTRPIPLVALSSFAMPGEKNRALAAGCVGYIEKPIKALSFVATVKKYLKPEEPRT